ncbi:MAG: hypothetical protein KGZ82_11590 [Bacteroidales bacterium]|nr:hypothetical protein [Bacteroidales bacterium]
MADEVLFSEKQRFRQWWIWAVLLGISLFFLIGLAIYFVKGEAAKNGTAGSIGMLFITVIPLALTWLFSRATLETYISSKGIDIRFFPFVNKIRHIDWADIAEAYVREYKPLREFGGWGIRTGLTGRTGAWNVSGNEGLQLVMKNGTKLLIGTQKPEEIRQMLTHIPGQKQQA